MSTPDGRANWLADAKRRREQRRAQEARPIAASRSARLRDAQRRLEQEHRVEVHANGDYEAYRARGVDKNGKKFGRPPKPFTPPAAPQGKVNTTDPDSRNVKTLRGWVQGYNAQAVTTAGQIVIAAELTNSSADFGQLGPMVDAARGELLAAGVAGAPDVVLADAGYWHQAQTQTLWADGIQVLIPPDANKRRGTRPRWNGGLYAFMRRVLTTPGGVALYRQRPGMTEPVFGDSASSTATNSPTSAPPDTRRSPRERHFQVRRALRVDLDDLCATATMQLGSAGRPRVPVARAHETETDGGPLT